MIHELFDKAAEAKARQRQDEKDYKAKKRERARLEYHLRHKKDYDVLGVQLGASKDECKRAYRKLAVRWHPDKHPEGDARAEAEAKFKEIQRAFDALMTTDENQTIEALAAKGQREAERAVKELKRRRRNGTGWTRRRWRGAWRRCRSARGGPRRRPRRGRLRRRGRRTGGCETRNHAS